MAVHVYFVLLTLSVLFGTSFQQSATCPGGWSQYQNSCYLYVDEWATWDEANQRCADQGAFLAEPDTEGARQFLLQMLRAWGWVGATDRQTEGTWLWSRSRTPIDSSRWAPGQPHARDENEDCLDLYHEGWADLTCTMENNYTCEKSATVYIG